jgi:hypothetical protein
MLGRLSRSTAGFVRRVPVTPGPRWTWSPACRKFGSVIMVMPSHDMRVVAVPTKYNDAFESFLVLLGCTECGSGFVALAVGGPLVLLLDASRTGGWWWFDRVIDAIFRRCQSVGEMLDSSLLSKIWRSDISPVTCRLVSVMSGSASRIIIDDVDECTAGDIPRIADDKHLQE